MNKDKLIFADGYAIETETMPDIGKISVLVADVSDLQALKDRMTSDNLASVQTTNGSGITVGRYENLVLNDTWTIRWTDTGILVTFGLRDRTEVEAMRAEMVTSHAVYDSAIEDLGMAVSEISEGGN